MTKRERQIFDWLMGRRPDLDGLWFGDCTCCDKGRKFWWRRHLQKQLDRLRSK